MRFAQSWSSSTVQRIRRLTPRIQEILLLPDGGVEAYAPGSHIEVRVLVNGQPEARSYSLVGADPDGYRIAVQLAAEGQGGSRYMWSLEPGARIEASSPSNLFDLDLTRPHYCLIAGGIGITPLIGIADMLARREAPFTLHYCAGSYEQAAYLPELMERHGDKVRFHASEDGQRLDLASLFAQLPVDALTALCGPMRLLDDARRSWAAAGRSPVDLAYETFGSSGLLSTEAFRVRLDRCGTEIVVPANRSMLAALADAGHEIMSDCESGECGVCAVNVIALDGEIDHRDVFFSAEQREENRRICPCVSRAHGVVTVDTMYRPDVR